jgi:glycine/D-amino acid oxidase-like deaminating enzyme
LTGASAAYHLGPAVRDAALVAVIDRGDHATEASGRNGGNFELLPRIPSVCAGGLARERLRFLPASTLLCRSSRFTPKATAGVAGPGNGPSQPRSISADHR